MTKTKTKHTPTPFQKLSVRIISDDAGMLVLGFPWGGVNTFLTGKRLESKELIETLERAVNSHEALLEAAKKMFAYLQSKDPGMPFEDWEVTQGVQKAIAQAEGK